MKDQCQEWKIRDWETKNRCVRTGNAGREFEGLHCIGCTVGTTDPAKMTDVKSIVCKNQHNTIQ